MVKRKRTSVINLRVTPQEKYRIERYAKKCRLSVSEYLRQLANGYAPRELPTELIDDLQRIRCQESWRSARTLLALVLSAWHLPQGESA